MFKFFAKLVWKLRKLILIFAIFILYVCYTINSFEVHSDVKNIPFRDYALVLGVGKFLKNGGMNMYYIGRIDATAELYKAKKVGKIIISGDNSRKDYNEPQMMKDDLIAKGVPADAIVLDYAGFRTLDSVRRCKNVFRCNEPIVITQYYHAKRALYLCDKNDMNAIAFEAPVEVPFTYILRNNARELLAWIKAWIDINITNKKAKFEK